MWNLHQKRKDKDSGNKSAITDHASSENHVIDWENVKVIDRESDKTGRLIREEIWIRTTENVNQDEGSYQPSHIWGKLLHSDDSYWKSHLMKQKRCMLILVVLE